MIEFGQPVHEKNYLKKTVLKTQRFCTHFLKFHKGGNFLEKYLVFLTLNAHISRTINAIALNESILKSSH